jgi:hypothetical protein
LEFGVELDGCSRGGRTPAPLPSRFAHPDGTGRIDGDRVRAPQKQKPCT